MTGSGDDNDDRQRHSHLPSTSRYPFYYTNKYLLPFVSLILSLPHPPLSHQKPKAPHTRHLLRRRHRTHRPKQAPMLSSSPPPRPVSRMGWHEAPDSDDEDEYNSNDNDKLVPRLLANDKMDVDRVLEPAPLSPLSLASLYPSDSDSDTDSTSSDDNDAQPPRKRKRACAISCRSSTNNSSAAHKPPPPHLSPSSPPGPGAGMSGEITADEAGNNNNNKLNETSPPADIDDMPPSPRRRKCRTLPAIIELEEGELELDSDDSAGPLSPPSPSPAPKLPMSPPARARYSHKQLAWRAAMPERQARECTPPKFRRAEPRLHLLGSARDEKRVYALLARYLGAVGDTRTLTALMRVSRAAYTPSVGELYRSVVVTSARTPALVNTLTWPLEGGAGSGDNNRRTRLRRHVRGITIESLPPTAPAAAAWIGVKGYPLLPLCGAADTVALRAGAWEALGESTLLASMVRSLASPASLCVEVHASHGEEENTRTPRLAALILSTWLLPAWSRLSRVTVHAAQVLLSHASAETRRALFRPGVGYVLVFSQCSACAPGVDAAGRNKQERKRIAVTRDDRLWACMQRSLRVISSEVGAASGMTVVLPHDGAGATLPLPAEWARGRPTTGAGVAGVAAEQVFGRSLPTNFAFLRVEDCGAVCNCCNSSASGK